MKRGFWIVVAVIAVLVISAGTIYGQSYQSFLPLLIDLPGWQGDDADGADMNYGGIKSSVATREYNKGNTSLEAGIIVGQQSMGTWIPAYQEGFKMDVGDMSMEVTKVRGFMVNNSYDKKDKSGSVIVLIKEAPESQPTGGVFLLAYDGIDDKEAMSLAQKFNWAKMREEANKF